MSIQYTNYDPDDRPAWEALRNSLRTTAVGGSEIASAANIPGAFSSAYAMWADVTGLAPRSKSTSAYLEDGRDIEEIVARRFEQASGFTLRHRYAIIQNTDYPHLFANVDRFVDGQDAGWEGKTYDVRSTKFDDGVPKPYIAQITVYLAVTGKKRWYLSAWAFGQGTKHFLFTTDPNDVKPDWCDAICLIDPGEFPACEKIAADFIMHVATNVPPAVAGTDADAEALRAAHPASVAGLEADLAAYGPELDRIAALDAEIEEREQEKERHRQTIMAALGDAERGRAGAWNISYKTSETRRLDTKKAKAELGAALDPYYTVSATRTLRISRAKVA